MSKGGTVVVQIVVELLLYQLYQFRVVDEMSLDIFMLDESNGIAEIADRKLVGRLVFDAYDDLDQLGIEADWKLSSTCNDGSSKRATHSTCAQFHETLVPGSRLWKHLLST